MVFEMQCVGGGMVLMWVSIWFLICNGCRCLIITARLLEVYVDKIILKRVRIDPTKRKREDKRSGGRVVRSVPVCQVVFRQHFDVLFNSMPNLSTIVDFCR